MQGTGHGNFSPKNPCTREQCLLAAEEGYTSHLSSFCPVPVTKEAAEMMAARMYDDYQ